MGDNRKIGGPRITTGVVSKSSSAVVSKTVVRITMVSKTVVNRSTADSSNTTQITLMDKTL